MLLNRMYKRPRRLFFAGRSQPKPTQVASLSLMRRTQRSIVFMLIGQLRLRVVTPFKPPDDPKLPIPLLPGSASVPLARRMATDRVPPADETPALPEPAIWPEKTHWIGGDDQVRLTAATTKLLLRLGAFLLSSPSLSPKSAKGKRPEISAFE
jgi:hypothetical protein